MSAKGATKDGMEGGLWLDPACGIAQRREGSKCMTAKI
jgi:hypothetical protein